jgi:hypothetical protein
VGARVVDGLLRALVALVAVVGEQPVDDALEHPGHGGRRLEHRRGRAFADPHDHHRRVLVQVGVAAGEQLVGDDAHRVEVTAVVDLHAERLLGRHIAGRAHEHAGGGELAVGLLLGDAEVRELHQALARHEQVGRLDVAVDDPLVMGVAEPGEHIGDDARP